ncbi:MAG: lipid A-modifier LpxR family protein [Flavobacterium sp.]
MKSYLLILMFFCSLNASSQGTSGFQVLLTTDNDFLGIDNKDENYTGAAKIELLTPEIKWKWLPFYKFKQDSTVLSIQRFGFGGTAYTPQDIAASEVVTGDRPYASLTFFSFGNVTYNNSKKIILQSDLIIGSIGSSGPGNVQTYIHKNHWFGTDRPEPQGWGNQIGFNGSFIVNYNTQLEGLIKINENKSDFQWIIPYWVAKADLGNYMINLQGGLKLNLLNFNSGAFQDYIAELPTIMRETNKKKNFRFNFFVEPSFRLAAYNATLEGIMFNDNSVYKIEHSHVNRLLFEINSGINVNIGDFFYAKYSFYGRSKEYDGGKYFHTWGGITVGFSPSRWNYK